jgi:hypothetical protein
MTKSEADSVNHYAPMAFYTREVALGRRREVDQP